jgi:hypothetical protein
MHPAILSIVPFGDLKAKPALVKPLDVGSKPWIAGYPGVDASSMIGLMATPILPTT